MNEIPSPAIDPRTLVGGLAAALTARSLYPPAHPRVVRAIAEAVTTFNAFLDARALDEVSILRVGSDLAVAGEPLLGGGVVSRGFHESLRRHGLEGLTLTFGLDAAELGGFLGDLAEGRGAQPTPHIQVGVVAATLGGSEDEELAKSSALLDGLDEALDGAGKRSGGPTPGTLAAAREALQAIGTGRGNADVGALERLAAQALDALALATESILPLASAMGEEDHLFQHSLRVCYLTLGLGRALGFRGEPLRDLGVAAFLHDVGKLALPADVRKVRGRMDDATWRLLELHPELGAARLCGVEGVPQIAVLVAFEHHLRADGGPSFPALRTPRLPGLASQMVAVADAYDVFFEAVAGQGDAGRVAALTLLAERASRGALHPELVSRFAEMLPAQPA